MADIRALRAMQKKDPDGWAEDMPTEQDYKAFEEWAMLNFGKEAYERYMKGGWGKGPDV